MLRQFLSDNREELIERCRFKVAMRRAPRATPQELSHGVPLFLTQLTEVFAESVPGTRAARHSITIGTDEQVIAQTAARHGGELLQHGFTIEQVVHDYGDLCQSITELAVEHGAPIAVHEFGCLNITLDNAIASAVASYAQHRDVAHAGDAKLAANERLGFLANEMRNLLNTAILATTAMKRGSVGLGGATAAALDRSLIGMRGLIDRTLVEVRLESSAMAIAEVIEVGPFIAAVQLAAALEAASTGCDLTVIVQPDIFVQGDRHILAAAVANLLHGTVTSTQRDGHVFLTAYARGGRVIIDVEDGCGGLAHPAVGELHARFAERGTAASDLGFALDSTRKGIEASGGTLQAQAIPGKGCLYTIDLPEIA